MRAVRTLTGRAAGVSTPGRSAAPWNAAANATLRRCAAASALFLCAALMMPVLTASACRPLLFETSSTAPTRLADRPNILLISADDMRPDDLQFMPFTRGAFRDRGVTFADAISPYPLCCPARAQIVTGQYNHNNGVLGNAWPHGGYWSLRHPDNTLPQWLSRSGYLTGFVGKYMNEYGRSPSTLAGTRSLTCGSAMEVPPGWRYWSASVRDVYDYNHVTMNVDTPSTSPHLVGADAYQTSYIGNVTAALIHRFHRAHRPFFIWASHLAPHPARPRDGDWGFPVPAARDRGAYAGVSLPQAPAFQQALNAAPIGKYGPTQQVPPISLARLGADRARRAESLLAVDRAVRQAVRELKRTHEFTRTVIIFTSDNGYALGENRFTGKDRPYDSALRVPMIVNAPGIERRYAPAQSQRHLTVQDTVTTTDIAATIVGVSGAQPGRPLEGIDMTRPAQNPDHGPGGDRAVLIESGPFDDAQAGTQKWVGVRTDRYTWLAWDWQKLPSNAHGPVELYDRSKDAAQLRNLVNAASPAPAEPELRALATQMRHCRGSACVRSAP